jgi:putative DNA primase/helicase
LLLGKLVNIDSDMQQGVQLDSGIIKKIISWEHIVGKVVYEKPISFAPYTRLLLATNELPYLKSADQSIKRRFIFIHLKKSFIWQEDPTLKDKLKAEKTQIFVWAIEWLKRLLARWSFLIPDELQNDIDWFIKENDSVTQFLESWSIYIEEELSISNRILYLDYSNFCKDNGFKPLGQIKLGKRLVDRWYVRYTDGRERGIKWLWEAYP